MEYKNLRIVFVSVVPVKWDIPPVDNGPYEEDV
jgi:hypothetical protein